MSSLTAIFWDFFKIINEHFKYLILDKHLFVASLHEKRLNTELFLVGIFLYSDRILRFTTEISVFSPNIGKYGPQITPFLDTFHAVFFFFKVFYCASNAIYANRRKILCAGCKFSVWCKDLCIYVSSLFKMFCPLSHSPS